MLTNDKVLLIKKLTDVLRVICESDESCKLDVDIQKGVIKGIYKRTAIGAVGAVGGDK